jgi:hypothetical protein
MAFKPNYNFQKAERARAKAQKKQKKLNRLQEESEKRKAAQDEGAKTDETGTAPESADSA